MLRTRIIMCILAGISKILHSGYKASSNKASKIYDNIEKMEAQATDIVQKGEQAKKVADKLSEIL